MFWALIKSVPRQYILFHKEEKFIYIPSYLYLSEYLSYLKLENVLMILCMTKLTLPHPVIVHRCNRNALLCAILSVNQTKQKHFIFNFYR